jgi:nucleotide-binding universal stress UspA family protein
LWTGNEESEEGKQACSRGGVAERVKCEAIAVFPTRILLATDGSKESVPAVRTAVELAMGTGSELYVVHTISTAPKSPYPHYWQIQQSNTARDRKRLAALALLEEMIRQVEELGGIVAGSYYREGKPEEEVAQLAEEFEVGLIIAGGRELGRFGSLFTPSFSESVYRRARCAVLVVRGPKV